MDFPQPDSPIMPVLRLLIYMFKLSSTFLDLSFGYPKETPWNLNKPFEFANLMLFDCDCMSGYLSITANKLVAAVLAYNI